GDGLDLVDDLLALVVALARIPLRVLVGQHRATGLEDRGGHVVLRRDEPDLLELAARLRVDQFRDLRILPLAMRGGRLVHGDLLGHCAAPGGRGSTGPARHAPSSCRTARRGTQPARLRAVRGAVTRPRPSWPEPGWQSGSFPATDTRHALWPRRSAQPRT